MTTQLEQAARQALEALENAEYGDYDKKELNEAITTLRAALSDSALERKAENARELGLDYEPALKAAPLSDYDKADVDFHKWWYSHIKNDLMQPPLNGVGYRVARYIWDAAMRQAPAEQPAQDEPTSDTSQNRVDETAKQRHKQPCPYVISTREGTHYCSLSQREPLSDEQMKNIWYETENIMGWYSFQEIARAIEQAHGIGEKK